MTVDMTLEEMPKFCRWGRVKFILHLALKGSVDETAETNPLNLRKAGTPPPFFSHFDGELLIMNLYDIALLTSIQLRLYHQ